MNEGDITKGQKKLGIAIQNRRKALGYKSQETFAHDHDLDRTWMGKVERGELNITLRNLRRLAQSLNIEAHQLLKEAGL